MFSPPRLSGFDAPANVSLALLYPEWGMEWVTEWGYGLENWCFSVRRWRFCTHLRQPNHHRL